MFLAKPYCDFRYIEKHFSVCRDEKVIDVAAFCFDMLSWHLVYATKEYISFKTY